ncbi:hypothetical protein [Candidatus Lucifugimonas marina]|uniref:Uncharacterized protein n=1 Tax=Candidatus Lucifugimonas marina TaxID=3038979 RepID=A0AAJ6CVH8_9CHLR|nr:hypothetical protein [SAR202 cluster bacterium JH702]MDG0870176.1 hypothetical protein [SAR202 cluster bacterium JH639]WFG36271.1 hypothetical protein GKN94_11420 [SAR202 cluster bacterium JH545]WFG40204.1 hypothetical protein GKO48_11455 [SAR202 cluster bacterium JH1073]
MNSLRAIFVAFFIATVAVVGLGQDSATAAGHLRIAGVGGNSGNQAANAVNLDIPGTVTSRISAATYNAMSPADLRAAYDVLIFTWNSPTSLDADWATRIKPYIDLGGGVIFEDDGNIGDLAPAVIGSTWNTGGAGITLTGGPVPGLTDGIVDSFANNHLALTGWTSDFTPFITNTSFDRTDVVGLYGGSDVGCMLVQGPDMDFHGLRGASGYQGNQYNLLLNEIQFVTSGCTTNEPPECDLASPSVASIWPPNHKMVSVDVLGVTDPDDDPISITIDGITQDEPVNDKGDGNFAPDGSGVGTGTASVRAERTGTNGKNGSNGRVYEISFTADDGNGGTCTGAVNVGVPHDKKKGNDPVDDGQAYDSTVS